MFLLFRIRVESQGKSGQSGQEEKLSGIDESFELSGGKELTKQTEFRLLILSETTLADADSPIINTKGARGVGRLHASYHRKSAGVLQQTRPNSPGTCYLLVAVPAFFIVRLPAGEITESVR